MKPTVLLAMLIAVPALAQTFPTAGGTPDEDPYRWLEDVGAERSLDWVRAHNAVSTRELEASPDFKPIRDRLLSIYDSKARIPAVVKMGPWLYNFWRDAEHVRGLWRRTSLAEYRKPEPAWETVLDLDALSASENENWVWKGAECLHPGFDRCLLNLSRGGGDAVVVREFDIPSKSFVEDGFYLPEAKSSVAWRSRDALYVGTDFGTDEPGGSLTDSGYPRVVKEWTRGTPLSAARKVFEGEKTDVSVSASVDNEHGAHHEILRRGITFYTAEYRLRINNTLLRLDVPDHAEIVIDNGQLLVTLRKDWTLPGPQGGKTWPAGALLAIPLARFIEGRRDFALLFEPGPRKALAGFTPTRNHLIVNELDNVKNRLYVLTYRRGRWTRVALEAPAIGSLGVSGVDEDESDDYFLTATSFLTPSSLFLGTVGKPGRERLKQLPAFFDAQGLEVTQHEATSKDGTRVPYFQVAKQGLRLDGSHPTLLYGYGGFEISMTPSYAAGVGAAWLERGGVYVLANIRGGGEFGPRWHEAALKEHRQRAYDDFIAIAEDLIARKVTSTPHLGIQGGSNGGLLMGVMLTERPDLFGAVVCQVPLLDMRRYNQLLAGASWMGEYGNPDVPEEWAFISKYSPYQNVRRDVKYPRVLFTTSTRDDRVHPGHARKMAARMEEQGHDVLYYENIEGGHGGAANNAQQATMNALAYTFLLRQLRGDTGGQ